VTRLLLERGEKDGIHVISPSLQQSLTARLDRLGPAREVAQVGSVIGRGFSYGLLCTLTGMEDAALRAALEQLAEADILLVQGFPPDSDYRFKHTLIQDAAYENLLKSRRQVLHRRVAEILRERFPDTAAAEPEVLAHHFTQAGLTDTAIEWWGEAGDQALRRSAFQEAISHLGKAIEMADKTGASVSANQRLKIQTDLGTALMWSRGFGADEPKVAFMRARELAAAIDNATERFTIYYGLWVGNTMRGELGFAREIAETFLREADRGVRTTECGFVRLLLGHTCLFQGDFIEAQANLVEALSIYDAKRDRKARFRFGHDTGAVARACLAITKWPLGGVGPARALIEEAVAHAMMEMNSSSRAGAGFSLKALSQSVNRPSIALAAILVALALSAMRPPFLQYLRPLGDFYIALLKICVLPFLLSTIPLRCVRPWSAARLVARFGDDWRHDTAKEDERGLHFLLP
jgi:tetratricopeptide (TPR) repeat protein